MPDEIVIIDPNLAEYAGVPAWEGTAWRYADDAAGLLPDWARDVQADRQALVLDKFLQALPARYRRYNLTGLHQHAGNQEAINQANALQLGENLYLHGLAGNGKTHLAVATARRFAETGRTARFYGVVDLFNQIRGSFNGQTERPNLLAPEVLVLDDLGKVKPTEFVFQEIYAALEARWANELTTIFTANHGPKQAAAALASQGDGESAAAIVSRLASGKVAHVVGKDLRLLGGRA